MRCKNCGWDNPAKNVKCEKCNTLLEGSVIVDNARKTEKQISFDEFNPKQTSQGCKSCGFPIKPTDISCPNCLHSNHYTSNEHSNERDDKGVEGNKPQPKPPVRGTIIKGTSLDASDNDTERRKLAGFLVTYSLSHNGDFFAIYEGRNTIGRDADNDIVINDNAVSGEHITIAYYPQNQKFYYDIAAVSLTQNGAYINDKFIVKGCDELFNNDLIIIGTTKLIFIAIPDTFKQ